MAHAHTVRALASRIHAAGGAEFREEDAGSAVFSWRTRLGRWPFEMQVDRYALEVRCYLADELFCTGRIPEDECDALLEPVEGAGDAAALEELAKFVDGAVRADTRRFLKPPHADRHPDRRADPRMESTIVPKPARRIDEPA
jgi:hypothetical protein